MNSGSKNNDCSVCPLPASDSTGGGSLSGLQINDSKESVMTGSPYEAQLQDLAQKLDEFANTTRQQLATLGSATEWLERERWQRERAFSLDRSTIIQWLEKGRLALQRASAAGSQLLFLIDELASLTRFLLESPVISVSYIDRFETLARKLETQSVVMQRSWSDSQEWLAVALPSFDPELHTGAGQTTLACLSSLQATIRLWKTNHANLVERLESRLERRRSDPQLDSSGHSCPQCGATGKTGARFCAQCGSPLTSGVTPAALAPSTAASRADHDQELRQRAEHLELENDWVDLDLAMATLERLKALDEVKRAMEKAISSLQTPASSHAAATAADDKVRPKEPPTSPDPVHFSITAPAALPADGSPVILDVWAHLDSQRADVLARAKEERGTDTVRRGSQGPVLIERGTQIAVELRLPTLVVSEPDGTILWMGEVANTSFEVCVPEGARLGEHAGSCRFFVRGMQIARLHFSVMVGKVPGQIVQLATKEERVRTAFASYAHADQGEVLARIQGMLKVRPDLDIFVDVASLRSGEKYEQRLMEEIARREMLYLFWSQAARRSKWVKKEWRAALVVHGIDAINPVPLQPPEIAPPPRELRTRLHFNDWTLFFTRSQAL